MLATPDPAAVALRFNEYITAGDIDALTDLMSADHTFIDSEDHMISGRDACRKAWSGFFDMFPGYRNTFTGLQTW